MFFSVAKLTTVVSLTHVALGAVGPDCVNGPLKSNKICDRNAPPAERAAALVAALTQEEKLANLVSKAQGAPRLGLPKYNWWGEALHGVAGAPGINFTGAYSTATSFPQPLLMAAAFDDDLIFNIGTAIGIESRAFGNGGVAPFDYWTPNVNAFKDPRWGRGSETPGEDVLVLKRYARNMIRGLEGDNPKERRVIATCKHYAANDFEDWMGTSRHDFDAKVSPQDLAEYYLQPFQECARDSKVGSFMCAYNAVNGVPSCANTYLMETILRGHWKWTDDNNYITSDCEAVLDISENHKYAPNLAAGTALAFISGTDLSCEYESSSDIPGAWSSGALNVTIVDRALNRLYHGLVRAGYFDGDAAVYANISAADINSPTAQKLAYQSATDGIVMLKNDQTLPLPLTQGKKVAMVGFWANDTSKLRGGYSGPPPFLHTPLYAAEKLGLVVKTSSGPVLQGNNASDTWTSGALAAANASDYIIYFGGQDTSAAGETKDRLTVAWPAAQLTLLAKLSKLGKPLVVVQMGDMLDNTPLLENKGINSILWASWPGQDGGPAVVDILSGAKAVAGRLPVTQYPVNYTEEVPMTDMTLRPSELNPGRTYRWYDSAVQSFGYGLHYTSFNATFGKYKPNFSIQALLADCSKEFKDTCPFPALPIRVSNTGNRTSDFVALAFVKSETGPKPYPLKTLAAYTRLRDISPGKPAETSLEWTLGNIARHDKDGNTVLYPGKYQVLLDEPTQAVLEFSLRGKEAVLDKWPSAPE
ncbi:glycoside hydrolase family 3 protein [Sporormia fimetaria CBS 119925]|uniref:xylan 1,4-beta-xylosidase n=1 Tax=Sporormia fimetaria CBS 119925 TaxID=1340428 RepID=A0A6A6UZ68_9PLEO|nr:glycoside hydrolase family 3 protein [Sporormia fimetaria CBS 119925]